MRHGISLEQLERSTRVTADLWRGLEENDLSRWPSGIYARSYVRQYAEAIGLDPDATVDEFCRRFPNGDRRSERLVRGQATIVGHTLDWKDDQVGVVVAVDRRRSPAPPVRAARLPALLHGRRGRVVAAVVDAAVVTLAGFGAASLLPIGRALAIAITAVLYPALAVVLVGCTPAVWAVDTYTGSHHPSESQRPQLRRLLFLHRSDRRA